ncbi:MAG: hypothetical protein IK142_08770 [Clostridiales bacterium]|nr:hypothetical protein [Clostridiales bacterium]
MLSKNYPPHDINKVFDMFEETINRGGVADKTGAELTLINKLFAHLPPEASEYGMMMLHGTPASELPQQAKDVMPLYVRFLNLAEYLEKVDALREVPASLTTEQIMERHKMMDSLEEHEKAFAAPLLGFKVNEETNEAEEAAEEDEQKEGSSALHLMNACAPVFACLDPLKTSLFYEKNLGFKATHLDDEKMPHIRLTRDNIVLALVESPVRIASPSMYELIIYVTEPMLLYHELKAAGVKIIEELPEAKESEKASSNRQFVIEDCDERRICISQSSEIV